MKRDAVLGDYGFTKHTPVNGSKLDNRICTLSGRRVVPEKNPAPYKIRNDLINSPLHPNQYGIAPIDLASIKKDGFIIMVNDEVENQTPQWGYNKGEMETSIKIVSVLWYRIMFDLFCYSSGSEMYCSFASLMSSAVSRFALSSAYLTLHKTTNHTY